MHPWPLLLEEPPLHSLIPSMWPGNEAICSMSINLLLLYRVSHVSDTKGKARVAIAMVTRDFPYLS